MAPPDRQTSRKPSGGGSRAPLTVPAPPTFPRRRRLRLRLRRRRVPPIMLWALSFLLTLSICMATFLVTAAAVGHRGGGLHRSATAAVVPRGGVIIEVIRENNGHPHHRFPSVDVVASPRRVQEEEEEEGERDEVGEMAEDGGDDNTDNEQQVQADDQQRQPSPSSSSTTTSTTKSLTTTFDSNNASFGNMFSIVARGPSSRIGITSFDIHTDLTKETTVEIYTRDGTYQGYEDKPDAWTLVCRTTVVGAGKDQITSLPPDVFSEQYGGPVIIGAGKTRSFYLTLPTEDIMYTNDDSPVGNVYAQNADIQVLVGTGMLNYQFVNEFSERRVFNGIVYYEILPDTPHPTLNPTVTPVPTTSFPTTSPTLDYSDTTKQLVSTLAAGNGGFGSFFDVRALKPLIVRSIDFHTDMTHSMKVEVYTRTGTFVTHETDETGWTLIADTYVTGAGSGKSTSIPPEDFTSVTIDTGEVRAFYVTLTTKDLRYSNTELEPGTVYKSNTDMVFLVGVGAADYPFGNIYEQRVFNGRINYGVVDIPTEIPSSSPSTHAVANFDIDKTLISTYDGGNGSYGSMFDIVAKTQDLVVRAIEFSTEPTGDMGGRVEVYTKQGSYINFEEDPSVWTKIADEVVVSDEAGKGTLIEKTFAPVTVRAGEMQAFYVTMPSNKIQYTNTDLKTGDVFVENLDVQFLVGVGVGQHSFSSTIYDSRVFNGAVHYSILAEVPTSRPTSEPTIEPTSSPTPVIPDGPTEVVTQQLIQIEGMSSGARRRLMQHARAATGSMNAETERFFQETTMRFLNRYFAQMDPPVHINRVDIAHSMFADQEQGQERSSESSSSTPERKADRRDGDENGRSLRWLQRSDEKSDGGNNDDNSTKTTNSTHGEDDGNTFDVYTTIGGEYTPPPFVDFSVAVEDTFDDSGDTFVEELKEGDEFFEEATGVKTFTVSFPVPTPDPMTSEGGGVSDLTRWLLIGVYAGCSSLAAIIIAALVWYYRRRRNRRRKEEKEWRKSQRRLSGVPPTEYSRSDLFSDESGGGGDFHIDGPIPVGDHPRAQQQRRRSGYGPIPINPVAGDDAQGGATFQVEDAPRINPNRNLGPAQ